MSYIAPDMDSKLWRFQLLDLVVYVTALVGLVYGIASGLSVLLGSSLVVLVHFGFVVGFLAFGYSTFLLWPSRPWKVEVKDSGTLEVENKELGSVKGDRDESPFQRAVQRFPPLRQIDRPASDRLSPGLKLFVASLAILAVSYLIEVILR